MYIFGRLQTRLLAEDSDEEDASAWVSKSREIEAQKRQAAQRVSDTISNLYMF